MKRLALLLVLASAGLVSALSAGTLTVTVKDSSGSVVAGATVMAQGGTGTPRSEPTGKEGVALFANLAESHCRIVVKDKGFQDFEGAVEVKADSGTSLSVNLTIAPQQTAIEVDEKTIALANSDPNYRLLRNAQIAESFLVENLELKRDVGTFVFRD